MFLLDLQPVDVSQIHVTTLQSVEAPRVGYISDIYPWPGLSGTPSFIPVVGSIFPACHSIIQPCGRKNISCLPVSRARKGSGQFRLQEVVSKKVPETEYISTVAKEKEEENIARIAKSCPENISSVVKVSSCFY